MHGSIATHTSTALLLLCAGHGLFAAGTRSRGGRSRTCFRRAQVGDEQSHNRRCRAESSGRERPRGTDRVPVAHSPRGAHRPGRRHRVYRNGMPSSTRNAAVIVIWPFQIFSNSALLGPFRMISCTVFFEFRGDMRHQLHRQCHECSPVLVNTPRHAQHSSGNRPSKKRGSPERHSAARRKCSVFRGQCSEVRGQRSDVGGQTSEVRGRRPEIRIEYEHEHDGEHDSLTSPITDNR